MDLDGLSEAANFNAAYFNLREVIDLYPQTRRLVAENEAQLSNAQASALCGVHGRCLCPRRLVSAFAPWSSGRDRCYFPVVRSRIFARSD